MSAPAPVDPPPVDPAPGGGAVDPVALVVAMVVTSATLTALVSVLGDGTRGPWWWAAPVAVATAVSTVGLLLAAVRRSPPERAAALYVAVTAFALVTGAGLAGAGVLAPPPQHSPRSWVAHLAVGATACLAAVVRRWPWWAGGPTLVVVASALAWWRARPPHTTTQEAGLQVMDGAYLVVAGLSLYAVLSAVDDVTERLGFLARRSRAAVESSDRALDEEADRNRWEALVHDEVLSALLSARTAPPGQPRSATAQAARAALRAVTADPRGQGATLPALVERTTAAAHQAHPAAVVRVEVDGGGSVPGEVADALVDATAELVRNAARHAGPGVVPVVTGRLAAESVTLRVEDDGRGFDTGAVDPARLGLRVSVLERVRLVGGAVALASSPGAGTRAQLRWPAHGPAHGRGHGPAQELDPGPAP